MARLIPRKQIEEQQNISSSLNIGQDVNVGNNAIISGSLFVSRSFFLGSDENDVSEITGSVFLTGSLEIDGELVFKGPEAILSATSSNTLLAVDTQRYAGILAKDFGANQPTLYVSSTDGDDTNDGRTIQYPLRTIKRAAQLSAPGYDGRYGFDTGSVSNGYVIKVQAGTYLEDNPVILPKNTTIWGAGLRITKINAKNPTEDLFYVNSGCYVAEVTMGGLRLFPDQINPERGFAIAFQPGAFITTSPYIQNCSQISNQDNSFTELYEEIPPGGGGLYVNGDVIDPDSPLASMVLDAYTQISPNGVGCLVNGRGFIQLVSFFNNFSYYAIRVNNGGHATLNNSNISFGLYGMYASGSRFISGSGGNIDARNRVRAGWSVVVDVLNRGIDALPSVTTLNTAEGIKTTQFTQSYLSGTSTASIDRANEVVSDFNLVSAIVENGTANFPTLLARSSNKGYGADSPYNILGAEQITSSIASASINDIGQVSSSFGVTLGIFANGTGSYVFKSNTEDVKTISGILPESATTIATNFVTGSVSSSFDTIITILKRGLTAIPKLVSNNSSSVYANTENIEPFSTGVSSSLSTVNYVSSSLSIVYNILANGTGSNIEDIPQNHIQSYTIVNNNSSSYNFVGTGNNPDLVLFRGLTYKFYVSASDAIGGVDYPFWIRTKQIAGIDPTYDYNDGVINNGDSVGNITFSIPYDAPDELFYVSQPNSNLGGKLKIINSSTTPRDLIESTLTFPATILSSSAASNNVDIINAYDILINNKEFIKEEVITFLSSSWSNFDYNETTCKRDVGYIIDGAAKDLLFGGNEESIRSGLFYYQFPSEATTIQKDPTLTAIKYASRLIDNLLRNKTFSLPNSDNESATSAIFDNREFIQNETITYLSSSWSTFEYNQEKCKRDVGYILDAVATDLKYGGNERSIEAGRFYYLYPSEATTTQVNQTVDGIKYAAGLVKNIILNKTFTTASQSTKEAYDLIRNNKSLIQNETIEFINVAYPTLDYNTAKCRRDVGFILDGVATDLLYGGNERSVTSGRYYYDFPSIATSIQKVETSGGIRYTKIITEYIIQNLILDTPRIIYNDEKNIKVTALNNVTSSLSGSQVESALISSSFNIVEGIIKRGIESISSIIAQNTNTNWSISNPVKVSSTNQITNSFAIPTENYIIDRNFEVVTNIIANGIGSLPTLTSSIDGLIKVSNEIQYTGSSATNAETASISSSMVDIINVIINGTGSLQPYVSNVNSNIKVTNTAFTTSTSATGLESASISSSMEVIKNVLNNGLSVLPNLVQNTSASIKVTNSNQYISASYSASALDVSFISASISIVTDIISRGYDVAPTIQPYTNRLTSSNSVAAYEILKNNISFIQNETIAYLSSSWAGFEYDEAKCKRDLGFILSGSAEDLIWNSNSASVVNGVYYYDFPSQATDSQLQQTLDGINYASKLAQKVIQNVVFQNANINNIRAKNLLINNKEFIQNETIAYISSSWSVFEYNETTCKRDVGYILDAVATDLIYGGNERVREAGRFYYLYPSEATGNQLIQTTDAINYASRIAQKIVVGQTFTSVNSNKLNASNLLLANQNLIAEEVVAYVSSSWSGVYYNEDKCKRDTKYILDAVRTDLVYGGNERSRVAGLFYYLYPSSATVAGVPSPTNQLDMTVTGLQYASQLAQKVVLNNVLQTPIQSIVDAASLIRNDIQFIQENVIEYTNETYPNLNYIEAKCFRDVRFIVDAVVTDLVYGGNERSRTAGYFYYLYPSQATDDQLNETIDAINFGRDLTKLVSIGGLEVERGFDIVGNIITSGSSAKPTIISNTQQGIKATNEKQYVNKNSVNTNDLQIVSSSFGNVINIIANGTGSIPEITSSVNRGVNRIGGTQITSSIDVAVFEINKVTASFDTILDIVENGLGVLPVVISNANDLIKVTNSEQYVTEYIISTNSINNVISSFDIVTDIIENGTGSMVSLVTNANSLVKVTNVVQYTTATDASSKAGLVTSSFDTILNIIENGTSVIPTLVENTTANIRMGSAPTYGTAATSNEALTIGSLFDNVTYIVQNGTGSVGTLNTYGSESTDANVLNAYNNLKANISFIQNETIAYLSSSWSTASYDESKCRRDVGLIVSGAAEDLLHNSNSASLMNGYYYYLFPSLAETAQLNQTLDGINYAKRLAKKIVVNTTFIQPTAAATATKDLLINNKSLIADEVVAYISSSWTIGDNTSDPYFYNETTCKRDVGYILDAVATDIVYGGNERTSKAGEFYYLYPSQATGYQLDQTLDGVRYAKNIAEQIVKGNTLVSVSQESLESVDLIDNNKTFISNEVVAFISSSWSEHEYNEAKCKRDVGYILDAVKTDLKYGGNERSRQAGEYYYKYPSNAIGSELAPTLTGVRYAKELTERILGNLVFVTASISKQTAYDLLKDNKAWIQNQTIANINAQLDTVSYNETTCKRDVGYIVDAVATDVLYGGNERATEAGRYYYLFPSNATGSELVQTLEGIVYAKDISTKIISNELVYTQITSSLTPSTEDINKVSTGFDLVVDIISNGTGSIPSLVTNATGSVKITNSSQYITTASISETHIGNIKNGFDTILNIVSNGTSSLPSLVKNTNALIKVTDATEFYNTASISRTVVNNITSSFDRIINILRNGIDTLPTIVTNTSGNIKVTNTPQYIGGTFATSAEVSSISASIGIVANIVNNGTSVAPTIIEYVSQSTNPNVLAAYDILKNNISFIQNETIAYLSSSWSTASYNEAKCKRDVGYILSGSAEDLLWGANSASVVNGNLYYDFPSLAETAQLNQTLDGIRYASELAQKVVLNVLFQTASVQIVDSYNTIRNNRRFIQSESIAYISSSWSTHQYNETTCKRDISYILDAVSTDILYGGNERTITSGIYYYLYPSEATGSQLDETITGINYAKNLIDRLLKNSTFQTVTNNKLQAKDLIVSNKNFIANEVIAYVSASWNGFVYNEETCKRDVGYILDAVATDMVYGGNERSIEAGRFYYDYPSEATTIQLGPTLSGIKHAKGLTQQILKNVLFATASNSSKAAYNLLVDNKEFIQNETIAYVNSAWSFFDYNEAKCRRDVGYIVDAVATDILYGGNERTSEAGEYYYLYPSLATVDGDGDAAGQLGQTLDGVNYAKGISEKIVSNILLQSPTTSQLAGFDLLVKNKSLIQKETIAYLSSSWTGVDGFYYNEASCSRDVAYIVDNVATDLLYGGNERSSKAGEYYYLYPSKAIVKGVPSVSAQLEQTLDGIKFTAGVAQNIVANKILIEPTLFVSSSVSLMKQNRTFIQNETIQYIDAFFPDLVYNREKCRRDVGYIVDNVSTDLFYGGNERSIIAGDYYYRYPSLATKQEQVRETVSGVDYAKNVSRKIVQNILLESPVLFKNTDYNIKATNTNQYTSSISVNTAEISKISSSFSIVTDIIAGGVEVSPIKVLNTDGAIKVTNETPITSSINGGSVYADLVTSSFNLVRDIIYYGEAGIPDALARNYDYGFQLSIPTLLHISSTEQSVIAGTNNASDLVDVSASYATIIDIVNNGTGSIPTIIENTSSSINVIGGTTYQSLQSGSISDINKIGTGFEIVTGIIEGTYPTIVSNNTNGIKVTNTPQLITGSGADRIQSKIVSASFGVVTSILNSNTSSVQFVNSNVIPNSNSKINLAYNLLLGNKEMIIDETIAYMSSSWSTFDYNEASCRRDLGFIIDGAAYDLIYGGNSASFVNGKYYYDFPSQATGSQLDQTITAINYASGLAEKVVRNTTLTHISASQSTSASYVSLLKNKEFIQNEAIAYVSSSWMEFDYNEATCRRDIGYIIDAVATDLLYGGNERSWTAGDYYFRYPSQATTSQLQPTLDGINYAKGVAMNVAKNTTFVTADVNTQFSYDILLANKEFIQNEAVAFVNAKYPNLYYDQIKCKRDVGYIVDAVATDLLYGGNERAAIAGEFYYLYPSLATEVEQVVETTAAIDYARRLSLAIIQKIVIPTPQVVSNTFNNIKVTNVPQINGVAATQIEATAISSSIGIVTNIVSNGTGSLPTIIPYTTQSIDPNVINAYNNLKANIAFIAAETVAYISSSWVTGSNSDTAFVYNDLSCSRDVSLIVSGAAEDLLWNSNSASVVNGKFYYEYPSQATNTQLDETLDGISYASQLAQKIVLNTLFVTASASASAVYEALKVNKPFIQAETIAFVSSSWNGLLYIESKCKRDVGLIVDAVATDILYGGNQRSATAGQYYFKYPSLATGSQLDSTLNAIDFAGGTAKNVITNTTFVTASQSVSASVELLRNNRLFIQNETMAYLTASWSSFEYNKDKCKRDVGFILDGVATDILYGGNERSVMSGDFYYKYPSKATLLGDGDGVGQLGQTLDGIIYASRIAQKVARNTQFVTASSAVSASFDLLRKNKNFIAAETIAYVSSSWSGVYYNQASCSRDVQYIIDAAATDVFYGGTERSVTAGSYYFLFPSKATNAGVPSEANQLDPTVTGVRYAGRLASKSVLNPTYVNASIDNLNARRLLQTNKLFIQKETIAFLSSSWSTLKYNEVSCSRDLGFILDAVSTDLVYGGNERSIEAGSFYYKIPSVAIKPSYTDNGTVGQLKQTVDGVNYAKGISEKIVNQTQLVFPQTRRREAYSRLISAKEELKQRAIGYTNGAFPYLVYNEASCSRDTGLIVDAVATDLLYGGNERSIAAASSYYTGQYGSAKAVINEQKLETLETNRYLRTRAEFVAAGAPVESFGSLIVATGIDYSYNGSGVTFKALPPNQGGSGVPNPIYEITELAGGRIYFTSGNQDGDFRIGTGLSINQATGTLVGRTFSKSLFSLVTPFSLALEG